MPATRRLPASEQAELVVQQLEASGGALSARARSQAKRKAKQAARQSGGAVAQLATTEGGGVAKKQKTKHSVTEQGGGGEDGEAEALVLELVPDGEEVVGWEEAAQWPFEPLCAELRCSLFHAAWPRRHGAAAGLRAVLKAHGASAGVMGAASAPLSAQLQAQWQADCAIRLLCVLALDRFGDWAAGDKVTAPVRETAAQALSVLLRSMGAEAATQAPPPRSLARHRRADTRRQRALHSLPPCCDAPPPPRQVAEALLTMQAQQVWEVRHGGMLGLKYVFAVREDLLPELLPRAAPTMMGALLDADDDVRCVAAESLLGVASHAEVRPPRPRPRRWQRRRC